MIRSLTFVGLLSFGSAHAVEFLPCQRALAGDHVTTPDGVRHRLDAGQIVVRGKLEAFWETGMEDQTGWCIFDHDTYAHLSANGYDALHNLDGDALVYITNDRHDEVVACGTHAEVFEPGTVNIGGREIAVSPNRPRLLEAPGTTRTAIPDPAYREHFQRESPAIAIVRPHPTILKNLDEKLAPLILAYERHLRDESRFIAVGSGRTHERQMFESVIRGTPEVRDDGRVRVHGEDGPVQLIPHDRVYLLTADDQAIGSVDIRNFPAQVNLPARKLLHRAGRVVVIRKGFGGSWAEETDF